MKQTRSMQERVSGISLIVYAALLMSSGCLLSVPGDYWQWFVVTGIFALPPVIFGPHRYRIWGASALGLAVLLTLGDIKAGKIYQEKFRHTREAQQSTNVQ